MSTNDQHPEPDNEPAVAHYERADASKFPTTPEGQQAAVEGMAAAQQSDALSSVEISRRDEAEAERPIAEKYRDQMLELLVQHEREVVARRALAGDPNPTDADPLAYVHLIAEDYAKPETRAALLDELADELDLDDVRVLRIAGEAAKAATPRVIMAAADRGMSPPRIAADLGLTSSRVYEVIRIERQKRVTALVEAAVAADADTGGDPRDALARYSAALADVPEEHREAAEQYIETLRAAVARHQAQPDSE
ncbi:hypothetical protein ACWGJ2_04320 [Streptomyces sp. NPDC054796]